MFCHVYSIPLTLGIYKGEFWSLKPSELDLLSSPTSTLDISIVVTVLFSAQCLHTMPPQYHHKTLEGYFPLPLYKCYNLTNL
ncbi:hypothetical protein OPQ81_011222 [Rhizoctonia solani]|nr:hypothetical protein OPQ81_011222 [Rhizoctonia solani]